MVMKGRGAAATSSSRGKKPMKKVGKMDKGVMTRLKERRKGKEQAGMGLARVGGRAMEYIERDGGLMGVLPPEEMWIKTAEVQWLGKEGKWHARRLILSRTMLIMTHPNETAIKDQIPLVEIENIDSPPESSNPDTAAYAAAAAAAAARTASAQSAGTTLPEGGVPQENSRVVMDILDEAELALQEGVQHDGDTAPSRPESQHGGGGGENGDEGAPGRPPLSNAPSSSSIPFVRGLSANLQQGLSSALLNTVDAKPKEPVRKGGGLVQAGKSGKQLVGATQIQDVVMSEVDRGLVFEVHTEQDGYNCGRAYIFQSADADEASDWIRELRVQWHAAVVEASNLSRLGAVRLRVEIFVGSNLFQGLMALLIVGNFVINVVQSELKFEAGSYWDGALNDVEIVLTFVFGGELVLNLFANWFSRFANDGWSIFDFIVVTLSFFSLLLQDVGDVNVLRLLRPLRVVRLLGRLRSLRLIINACTRSLVPVSNAFLVTFLITAIYAILGVSAFDQLAPEYFGRFSLALFTMFQISTGDAWSSEVSRVMLRRKELCTQYVLTGSYAKDTDCYVEFWEREGTAWAQGDSHMSVTRGVLDPMIVIFFSSFVIVVGLTLLNVVVAVLLDNFTAATETEKDDMQQKSINEQAKPLVEHPLDPLLAKLVLHDSTEELSAGIAVLFRTFDTSLNGTISREEMSEGLRKIKTEQIINLSEEDFTDMTDSLLDSDGELEAVAFELMLRRELSNFIQRHMARQIELSGFHGRQDPTVLFALKKLMLSVDEKLYKTVSKASQLAAAGDLTSYKKSLPATNRAAWNDDVTGGGGCPQTPKCSS